MSENKHTSEDLKRLQSYDLGNKIQISVARIMECYNRYDKKCYVSFSGGKDSTVLAWLCAQVCQLFNCKLVLWFSDTGLEFPELREHVKAYAEWIKHFFHGYFKPLKNHVIISIFQPSPRTSAASFLVKHFVYPLGTHWHFSNSS